ncbi:signal peptidase I [Vagococcus hydrophili]|uniref:Signal peptidase I n=1 Tax=Vagococcus hydrophili TaxID=2714947 RepID=A0A6G8AT69_9ENTE|nr:signal peptidase I [Vagococcus hydrophili]QIL48187.1 signal peptidase I [Vagococcus hydrophili]
MIKHWIKELLWLVSLVAILVAIRVFVFSPIKVEGLSMMPTLVDGEKAIAYKLGDIKRFDVVPLKAPDDPALFYVKRVIGLPGDTVEYKEDQLLINGQALNEPYLTDYQQKWKDAGNAEPLTPNFTLSELTGQQTVPENTYFVLGDNRRVSKDSRYPEVGFIPKDNIIGKAKVSFWPPEKWGMIK